MSRRLAIRSTFGVRLSTTALVGYLLQTVSVIGTSALLFRLRFLFLVQTWDDSIDVHDLLSTGRDVFKLHDDRSPERSYCPWACTDTCKLTVLLLYQGAWSINPDLLTHRARIPLDSAVKVSHFGFG